MSTRARTSVLAASFLALASLTAGQALAQVSLTASGTAVTENFDTLAITGSSGVLPTGWVLLETGTSGTVNQLYTAGTGSSNAGDAYSLGSAGVAERALGSLRSSTSASTYGAQLQNNTGGILTGIDIAYTGEQWRIGNTGAARDDRLVFEYSLDATSLSTGAWVAVTSLDFINPIKTATPAAALDGNLAANRASLTGSISMLSVANGATLWIRWTDTDATGADDVLSIDNVAITPLSTGSAIAASVNDVSIIEGNSGTSNAVFTVTLSAASIGGQSVTFTTSDGTATAGSDYTATTQVVNFAAGETTQTVDVPVAGDAINEADETFNVTLSLPTNGLVLADSTGVGTITNDDFTVTPINQIQGAGLTSPIANGTSVTTEGIVTGIKTNGFFIQSSDAEADANAATSEGILVFTGTGLVPASVVVGARVRVIGNVKEFIPSTDLAQPPTTELEPPLTVAQLSVGNPLPAPVAITAIDPAGSFNQLENLEHMRVSIASMVAVAGTRGFKNEANATGSTNGIFWATLPGATRPRREPGIDIRDVLLPETPVGVPRFDSNPETLRVDSDALLTAVARDLVSGQVIGAQTGILDYGLRFYTFLPDPAQTPSISAPAPATVATPAGAPEFTVASYNMERFFDDINDPATSDVTLTAAAFANRLSKASQQIRVNLAAPDIVSVVEMENLTTLQALASKISTDGGPTYTAFLVEGNDPGGIDVGFLVKTGFVVGATPRVTVGSVTQLGLTATYLNPTTNTQDQLNDRPPLVLTATINSATGGSANVTVIVNHLRSFLGITDPVDGPRIRAKRLAQAEFLANLVQARQVADANERIVVLGDFNAYEFNDGLVDTIGTIIGAPTPATLVTLAGADLVNPNLTRMIDASADYSYSFDGFTQSIDHIMVSQGLINNSTARSMVHIKMNADYPEVNRSNYAVGADTRLSDHDALLLRVTVASLGVVSTSCVLSSTTASPTVGSPVNYLVTMTPANAAGSVTVTANTAETCTATVAAGVSNCTLSYAAAGAKTINASFTGAAGFQNSTCGPLAQTIAPAVAGVVLTSSVNPSSFGQSTTFTASVTGIAPTGIVSFFSGATSLGTASLSGAGNTRTAALAVSILPVGSATITAAYAGDASNAASTSPAVTQVVMPAVAGVVLTSSVNPSFIGQATSLTATVTGIAPTGAVNFFAGATAIGTVSLSGSGNTRTAVLAISTLPVGSATITAAYAGNGSNAASTSPALTQVVQPGATSTTLVLAVGSPTTLTATVSVLAPAVGPATGSVTFLNGTAVLGSAPLVGGVAQLTLANLPVGINSFSARFDGNTSFTGSSSASVLGGNAIAVPTLNHFGFLLLLSIVIGLGLVAVRVETKGN